MIEKRIMEDKGLFPKVCQRESFSLGTQGAGCQMTHFVVQSRRQY